MSYASYMRDWKLFINVMEIWLLETKIKDLVGFDCTSMWGDVLENPPKRIAYLFSETRKPGVAEYY